MPSLTKTQSESRGEQSGSERREHERCPFPYVQLLGLYDEEHPPPLSFFQKVECFDVSSGGFSYWWPEPPRYEHVVVALGTAPKLEYMVARVVRHEKDLSGREQRVLVGCTFTKRVKYDEVPEGAELSSPARAGVRRKQRLLLDLLSGDAKQPLGCGMAVSDLMTKDLLTVSPNTPIAKVTASMVERDCRHMFVCDDHRQLFGVISDRDLHSRSGERAQDIMTVNPTTISRDKDVSDAVALLLGKRFSSLPVVDRGQLVGAITTTDLLLLLHNFHVSRQTVSDGQTTEDVSACDAQRSGRPEQAG